MATLESITKAKTIGLGLYKITGVEPSYEYLSDHVRIYWQPDRLKQMQACVEALSKKRPGDVRVDLVPVFTPTVLKKAAPYAIGILAAGFLLGKLS